MPAALTSFTTYIFFFGMGCIGCETVESAGLRSCAKGSQRQSDFSMGCWRVLTCTPGSLWARTRGEGFLPSPLEKTRFLRRKGKMLACLLQLQEENSIFTHVYSREEKVYLFIRLFTYQTNSAETRENI